LFRSQQQAQLLERARQTGAELIEVSDRVFDKIAYREGPDGWLATFPLITTQLGALKLPPNPLVIVAEGVEKPGNLGAMLRTADAAGVHAVIAAAPLTDWSNPNVVRSSKGALFSVPVGAADNRETIAWLRRHNIGIVAATPQATTVYTEARLHGAVAIAVGEEKYGLSDLWLQEADIEVRIPMVGHVNSLNVATAAALLVYEAVRQRSSLPERSS
jgi:TrmH family RNA methyltransferase